MSVALDKLVESVKPHDGVRFSGLLTVEATSEYQEEVDQLLEAAQRDRLTLCDSDIPIWINVMKGKGAEIEMHSEGRHPQDITVVLFLTTLHNEDGGVLVVPEYTKVVYHRPVKGNRVMFKSMAKHYVTPLKTDKTRITIAGLFHP